MIHRRTGHRASIGPYNCRMLACAAQRPRVKCAPIPDRYRPNIVSCVTAGFGGSVHRPAEEAAELNGGRERRSVSSGVGVRLLTAYVGDVGAAHHGRRHDTCIRGTALP